MGQILSLVLLPLLVVEVAAVLDKMAALAAALVISTCREDLEIRRAFLRLKEIMEVPTLAPVMELVAVAVAHLPLVNLLAR
jgi:hypothetical protein